MRSPLLLLAFFALTGATTDTQRFDLICVGRAIGGSRSGAFTDAFSEHFRVDLASGKWCEGDCRTRRPIADVQTTTITLTERRSDNESYVQRIDRETGKLTIESVRDNLFPNRRRKLSVAASCDRAAFSGFPEFKTIF